MKRDQQPWCRTCRAIDLGTCGHFTACDRCAKRYQIGDSPLCRDGHEPPMRYQPFIGYYDENLISPNKAKELGVHYHNEPGKNGVYVSSHGEKLSLMRKANVDYAPRRYGSGRPEF